MIRLAKEEDQDRLQGFLQGENCPIQLAEESYGQWFVAVEDHEILGMAKIVLYKEELPIVSCIYVREANRRQGLGDGLLRATLHFFDKRGYKWVLIQTNDNTEEFLARLDFIPLQNTPLIQSFEKDNELKVEQYYCCEPSLFFSRGCKSDKRK